MIETDIKRDMQISPEKSLADKEIDGEGETREKKE